MARYQTYHLMKSRPKLCFFENVANLSTTWDLKTSQMTYSQAWATQLRQECLAAERSRVQRIRENASLFWPTVIASDATVGAIIGKEDTYRRNIDRNVYARSTETARTDL